MYPVTFLDLPVGGNRTLMWLREEGRPVKMGVLAISKLLRLSRDRTRQNLRFLSEHNLITISGRPGEALVYEAVTPTDSGQGPLRDPTTHTGSGRPPSLMDDDVCMYALSAPALSERISAAKPFPDLKIGNAPGLDEPLDQMLERILVHFGIAERVVKNLLRTCPADVVLKHFEYAQCYQSELDNPQGYVVAMSRREADQMARRDSSSKFSDEPKKKSSKKTYANSWRGKKIEDWNSRDFGFYFKNKHTLAWPDKHCPNPAAKENSQFSRILSQDDMTNAKVRDAVDWLFENWEDFSEGVGIGDLPSIGILLGFWKTIVNRMEGHVPTKKETGSLGNRWDPEMEHETKFDNF